ncbi:MAG TPA: circularly permuted type 2 ATP-grasp protein [Vicinamibacterales bacterium]|nr:circularly permuted type 2 ATP-grasp protein [Vicinamibacterales bacterium]
MLDAAAVWNTLLSRESAAALCAQITAAQRDRRLRFGDRVLCPFLRPFFLTAADETRVKAVVETLWTLGERVTRAAMERPELLADLALSEDEIRLARIDPGYPTTSTAARADAFILPESLQFAEYNAESPAGPAYSQGLAALFSELPLMASFRERIDARPYRPADAILPALVASYREWGGTAAAPQVAIVDWRDVPTYSEFELLRDGFVAAGVPTTICDPRDLAFDRGRLVAGGVAIDLVYRRVLINDIVAREDECRALLQAYQAGAVCVANTLRCKIPHKKAFFAVLTDERYAPLFSDDERTMIRRHIPWTALVEERRVSRDGASIDLVPYLRRHRDRFVIKPNDEYGGTGVTLGWETTGAEWDDAIARAVAERPRGWVAQEKIAVRREVFPICDGDGVTMRDMLVDFAPYVFRGTLAGFLTRLSSTGLANVTSGGGQVAAFRVGRAGV